MSSFGNTLRGVSRTVFGTRDPFNDPKVRNFTKKAPKTVQTPENVKTIMNIRARRGVGMAPNILGASPYTNSNLALSRLPLPIFRKAPRPNKPTVVVDPGLSLARQKEMTNNIAKSLLSGTNNSTRRRRRR